MKQKIISIIIFLIIFLWFWISFWKEFRNFQEEKTINLNQNEEILKKAKNFEVTDIKTLENTDIFYTPYEELLYNFIDKIDKAEKEIFIEVYIFTEKRILESLKEAKKRWVSVKVILEKNPYNSENINNSHFKELQENKIDVVWSNPKNYYLNHTKFFIIDDLAIISTWNLTYSTFTINRDFFVFTKDKKILETLKNIFEADFSGKKLDFYDENLVSSPNYSRIKLEKLLSQAEKNIKIYIQYLKDNSINDLLIKAKKEKNIDIEIIVDKKQKDDENIKLLQENGISIKFFNWKTMHTKAILIDEKYLFLWSINFSKYSIDKNRELWIFLKNQENIENFLKIWEKDF